MRIAATFMLVSLLACFTAQARDQPSLDELRAMASRDDPWALKALWVMHDLNGEFDASFTYFRHAANLGNGRSQQLLANAYRRGRGTNRSSFMAAFWYAFSFVMCGAERLPAEADGIQYELSDDAWRNAWSAAIDAAFLRHDTSSRRPDCGEYFDGETWMAFVYPDKSNMLNDHFVGTFTTLDSCRERARTEISESGWTNADYECGLNCRFNGTLNVCKETAH